MQDFGSHEERLAARRVAVACKALNAAIFDANFIGVNCKVVDLAESWDDYSNLRVERMERRVLILPSDSGFQEAGEDWEPIDTAPPTGDPIQVTSNQPDHNWVPMTAYKVGSKWERPASRDGLPYEPTHWRRLPVLKRS